MPGKPRKYEFGLADGLFVASLLALGGYMFYRIAETANDPEMHKPLITQAAAQPAAMHSGAKHETAYRAVKAKITAYCPCTSCCGPNAKGLTSTGDGVEPYDGVAADPDAVKYKTKIQIRLKDGRVFDKEVDDTGGAMRQDWKKGIYHFDIRMADHNEAKRFGTPECEEVRIYDRK